MESDLLRRQNRRNYLREIRPDSVYMSLAIITRTLKRRHSSNIILNKVLLILKGLKRRVKPKRDYSLYRTRNQAR